jgi:hypothetical protein
LRQCELDRQRQLDHAKSKKENSLIGRTKLFAEGIKHVFPKMPQESAELPSFFDQEERLFQMYEIPADLQSKLFLPLLTKKARVAISRLSLTELDNYAAVKTQLLSEYRLCPRELRGRFINAVKRSEESYVLFAARLDNLLTYYLRSRGADSDIKKLTNLLVADKLKDCLPVKSLNYVLSLEGDRCFTAGEVADNADIYSSNYTDAGVYRQNTVTDLRLDGPVNAVILV